MKKKLYAAQAFAAASVLSVVLPASANTGLILQDPCPGTNLSRDTTSV